MNVAHEIAMTHAAIVHIEPLGFPWGTSDPFLFCAHHDDAYPAGNEQLGPRSSLGGRNIGSDFSRKDGWSMYHGDSVPGFPQHPHRGFETVTIARKGLVDHADSLGATARFGSGDVQWMTAGRGVVHSEMFPLLNQDAPNPLEIFQIWLNLPRKNKMVAPHFAMLWGSTIPKLAEKDDAGRTTEVRMIAGAIGDTPAPPPPPESWASQDGSDVAIWTIRLEPGAAWTLPAGPAGVSRDVYFFEGAELTVAGETLTSHARISLRPDVPVRFENGAEPAELLLLQGRPIGEPVAHYGPFVMNEPRELEQAILDYRATAFGGWPWQSVGPVHPRDRGRHAKHADGKVEEGR